MINLIVAGGGEGTYKNLWPITQSKDPDLGMRIAAVIDVVPQNELHPKMYRIIESGGIVYLHKDGDKIPELENRAGVVMTPNEHHAAYTAYFLAMGIPVYVEKPAVTNLDDLAKFRAWAWKFPRLVYAAEYCVDGKGLGALAAAGAIKKDDERLRYLSICYHYTELSGSLTIGCQKEVSSSFLSDFMRTLGRLKSIRGKLLEGEGTAGVADHRKWLLDGNHGGMIRDLASHLFGVPYDMGLATDQLSGIEVTLGRWEKGFPLGMFRPLENCGEGETFASVKGQFLTPYGMPTFEFEVGKYWPKHDRELVLDFENGQARLSYEKPFPFTVERNDGEKVEAQVTADFYPTLAFLDFKRFMEGKQHGHIGRAAAIVKFNETARNAGLAQAGLL